MVKFKIKANPSGQYYFPKEVREELGRELTLICNAQAAVVFPKNTSLKNVLDSIDLIMKDLKHRIQLENEASQNE